MASLLDYAFQKMSNTPSPLEEFTKGMSQSTEIALKKQETATSLAHEQEAKIQAAGLLSELPKKEAEGSLYSDPTFIKSYREQQVSELLAKTAKAQSDTAKDLGDVASYTQTGMSRKENVESGIQSLNANVNETKELFRFHTAVKQADNKDSWDELRKAIPPNMQKMMGLDKEFSYDNREASLALTTDALQTRQEDIQELRKQTALVKIDAGYEAAVKRMQMAAGLAGGISYDKKMGELKAEGTAFADPVLRAAHAGMRATGALGDKPAAAEVDGELSVQKTLRKYRFHNGETKNITSEVGGGVEAGIVSMAAALQTRGNLKDGTRPLGQAEIANKIVTAVTGGDSSNISRLSDPDNIAVAAQSIVAQYGKGAASTPTVHEQQPAPSTPSQSTKPQAHNVGTGKLSGQELGALATHGVDVPRMLASVNPATGKNFTPDDLRAEAKKLKWIQ